MYKVFSLFFVSAAVDAGIVLNLPVNSDLVEIFDAVLESNVHIDSSSVSNMMFGTLNATSGYLPSVDPNNIDSWSLDCVGFWPFDEYDASKSPDASLGYAPNGGPQDAQNYGALYLTSGGRYTGGGAFEFDRTGYVSISKSPFPQNIVVTTGFSMALWLYPYSFDSCSLWERAYDNIDLLWSSTGVNCRIRFNVGTYMSTTYAWSGDDIPTLNSWLHAGCAWNADEMTLGVWVNGTLKSEVQWDTNVAITGFLHSSYVATSIGNRPFSNPNKGFLGVLDEFAMWSRPLTAEDWTGMFEATIGLQPFRGVGFTSHRLDNISAFDGITMTIPEESVGSAIVISISTDSGINFCVLENGVELSMISQEHDPVCLFPAVSLVYDVQYHGIAVLPSITFSFNHLQTTYLSDDLQNWSSDIIQPVGMNLAGLSYYSVEWVFVDAFRAGGR